MMSQENNKDSCNRKEPPGRQSTEKMFLRLTTDQQRRLELESMDGEENKQEFRLVKDAQSAYSIYKAKDFIDDAMARLGMRGRNFYWLAGAMTASAIVCAICAFLYAMSNRPEPFLYLNAGILTPVPKDQLGYLFVIRVLYTVSIVGLFFVGIKLFLSMAKAYMHEAVRNYERRHALRFGWLYMELMGKDWDFKELQEAFQWNREATSAFREIDIRHISDTTLNVLLGRLNELSHVADSKAAEHLVKAEGK